MFYDVHPATIMTYNNSIVDFRDSMWHALDGTSDPKHLCLLEFLGNLTISYTGLLIILTFYCCWDCYHYLQHYHIENYYLTFESTGSKVTREMLRTETLPVLDKHVLGNCPEKKDPIYILLFLYIFLPVLLFHFTIFFPSTFYAGFAPCGHIELNLQNCRITATRNNSPSINCFTHLVNFITHGLDLCCNSKRPKSI